MSPIVSADKYKTPSRLNPKDSATRDKYYEIYQKYTMIHMTEKQLAEEYDVRPSYISEIIKHVTLEIGDYDSDVQLQVLIDKSKIRQQEIERMIQSVRSEKVAATLIAELRKIDMFIAKLMGLLSNSFIDNSDRSKKVINVKMSTVERGKSDERRYKEDIEVQATNSEQDIEE